MEPRDTIVEPDVRNAPLPSDLYTTGARYPRQKFTCVMLENQTASGEQSTTAWFYGLDIDCVPLVNNRRARSAFVPKEQCVFQIPASFHFGYFGVANAFDFRFVGVSARWLFARETPGASPTFMNVVNLWDARIPSNNDETLVRDHR